MPFQKVTTLKRMITKIQSALSIYILIGIIRNFLITLHIYTNYLMNDKSMVSILIKNISTMQ